MEKFEREQIGVDLRDRRDRGVTEVGVSGLGQRLDLGRVEILPDEGRHDPGRGFGIGNAPQGPDRLGPPLRNRERQIESAVTRQPREKRIGEAKRWRRPAR